MEEPESEIPGPRPSALSQSLVNEATSFASESQLRQVMAVQQKVLKRLTESKEHLAHFTKYSSDNMDGVCMELQRNSELLIMIKGDLDFIFKRIRSMKKNLLEKYPELQADKETW
eukprot:jgi/Botrbrau1/7797/Bobra.0159s0225.1